MSSLLNSTARHTRHDERDRRDLQLSLLCSLYKVIICKLFTNLSKYTFIWFIWFDGTNRICVCKSIKTTKLVQASTIACLPSAMLKQHSSTRSTRSSRLPPNVERVESCRHVTWRAKCNVDLKQAITQRCYPTAQTETLLQLFDSAVWQVWLFEVLRQDLPESRSCYNEVLSSDVLRIWRFPRVGHGPIFAWPNRIQYINSWIQSNRIHKVAENPDPIQSKNSCN